MSARPTYAPVLPSAEDADDRDHDTAAAMLSINDEHHHYHQQPVTNNNNRRNLTLIGVLVIITATLMYITYERETSSPSSHRVADVHRPLCHPCNTTTTTIVQPSVCPPPIVCNISAPPPRLITVNITEPCPPPAPAAAVFEPYPTAHRSLAGVYPATSKGFIRSEAEVMRPRTPGTRWYYYDHWALLPDTTLLQRALRLAQQDGLPQRRAALRPVMNATQAYRLERLRECIDILLVQGNWTKWSPSLTDILSWQWSAYALERCPFKIFTRDEIGALYSGKNVTVVGDSMGREVFFGVGGSISSRAPQNSITTGLHWTLMNGTDGSTVSQPVHVDLYRSNFAMVAAHSFDAIYHTNVIENEYQATHPVRVASAAAVDDACNHGVAAGFDRPQEWLPCRPHELASAASATMYIANAAAWEPRAFYGLYGFDWDLRDWERYKEDEYIPHLERLLDRMCSASPSTLALWRTSNVWRNRSTPFYGDMEYDIFMAQLNEIAIKVVDKIRMRSSKCDNLFVLDLHAVSDMRPELTQDGVHYLPLVPLWGQLIANAYALWNDASWPGPPSPTA